MSDTTLAPILADRAAAGAILCGLRLARRALASPDYVAGRPCTPVAFHHAIRVVRGLIWDAADNGDDCNRSQEHADAIGEELGIVGVLERVNALEHRRRTQAGEALADVIDRQLAGAITRLAAAMADPPPASN